MSISDYHQPPLKILQHESLPVVPVSLPSSNIGIFDNNKQSKVLSLQTPDFLHLRPLEEIYLFGRERLEISLCVSYQNENVRVENEIKNEAGVELPRGMSFIEIPDESAGSEVKSEPVDHTSLSPSEHHSVIVPLSEQ